MPIAAEGKKNTHPRRRLLETCLTDQGREEGESPSEKIN